MTPTLAEALAALERIELSAHQAFDMLSLRGMWLMSDAHQELSTDLALIRSALEEIELDAERLDRAAKERDEVIVRGVSVPFGFEEHYQRAIERAEQAEAMLARAMALSDLWERQQLDYPDSPQGNACAAAVRLCARELRAFAARGAGDERSDHEA